MLDFFFWFYFIEKWVWRSWVVCYELYINVGVKVKIDFFYGRLFKSRVEGRWNVCYMLYSILVVFYLLVYVIIIIIL